MDIVLLVALEGSGDVRGPIDLRGLGVAQVEADPDGLARLGVLAVAMVTFEATDPAGWYWVRISGRDASGKPTGNGLRQRVFTDGTKFVRVFISCVLEGVVPVGAVSVRATLADALHREWDIEVVGHQPSIETT